LECAPAHRFILIHWSRGRRNLYALK
jgi:hypothetical protein